MVKNHYPQSRIKHRGSKGVQAGIRIEAKEQDQ